MTPLALRVSAPLLALACLATGAGAAVPRPVWSLGVSGGSALFDPHLADYQWNLAPRPAWGAQAGASFGRFGLALRAGVAAATQHLDAAASPPDAAVRVTTLDLAGEAALARPLGAALLARASAGRVGLGWSPGRVTLGAGAGATTVELSPVHAWAWGAGAALRREVAPRWTATLAVERTAFSFDTAHRSGASVTYARETFGNWNGRLELARLFGVR
jgi:hypothetical protein